MKNEPFDLLDTNSNERYTSRFNLFLKSLIHKGLSKQQKACKPIHSGNLRKVELKRGVQTH